MNFSNYKNETIILENETKKHVKEFHKEITTLVIKKTLIAPDEVRASTAKSISELYYLKKKENRFYCVVVKVCNDGNFISTALTTSKVKKGKLIYKKGEK